MSTRTVTEGVVADPDRWQLKAEEGDPYGMEPYTWEQIRVGEDLFVHDGLGLDGLEDIEAPRWVRMDASAWELSVDDLVEMFEAEGWMEGEEDELYLAEIRLDLALAEYVLDSETGAPEDLKRLVLDAAEPEIEERLADGGVRLRVQLAPSARLAEAAGLSLPPIDVVLDLDAEDRPVMARLTAEVDGASADVEVRLTDWGADLEVSEPDPGDVDQTPWVAEEALATVPELLLLPGWLPDGLELVDASMYRYDGDGDECPSVELSFGTEAEVDLHPGEIDWSADLPELPYFHLSISPAGCADQYSDLDFSEVLGGHPARDDYGWEVLVGEAWVMLEGSVVDEDQLAAVAASIRPVTLDELVSAIPTWVADAPWW